MRILYTFLLYLIQPFILFYLMFKRNKVFNNYVRLMERYGFYSKKAIQGGIVLHSVSVGEVLSILFLVKELQSHWPLIPITITTTTFSGSNCVKSKFGNEVYHIYLPYDLPGAIKRFIKNTKPKLMIIVETEIWPNLISLLHKYNIPIFIINARLSERSMYNYKKTGKLIRDLMSYIKLIAVQNKEDGKRFVSLGLDYSKLTLINNLKFDIYLTFELAIKIISLRQQWRIKNRPVWIAASTHNCEEVILLNAHNILLKKIPNLLLILAPRHPERFNQVCKVVKKMKFNYVIRSSGTIPYFNTQVVILDTIGELMLLYGIANLAFIGGSLIKHGGHNPLEPAAHNIPVLIGPYISNFKEICKRLISTNSLIIVYNLDHIVHTIQKLLLNEEEYLCHILNTISILKKYSGSSQYLLKLIKPYIMN